MNYKNKIDNILKEVRTTPTRIHKIGDSVIVGNLSNCIIKEVYEQGKVYLIEYGLTEKELHGKTVQLSRCTSLRAWQDISNVPKIESVTDYHLSAPDFVVRGQRLSKDIMGGIIHAFYFNGINFNPPYQRELCWSQQNKEDLITSIFLGRGIGMVVYRKLPYTNNRTIYFEIIDGKQRVTTLVDFYEDRFKYKGKLYSELSKKDKYSILNHSLTILEVSLTDREAIEYFLFLNFAGIPQSQEHLNKVKKLLRN